MGTTQLRVGSATGPLMAQGGASGSATTGKWVSDGLQFFLVNAANGVTLATTTVNVTTNGCGTSNVIIKLYFCDLKLIIIIVSYFIVLILNKPF